MSPSRTCCCNSEAGRHSGTAEAAYSIRHDPLVWLPDPIPSIMPFLAGPLYLYIAAAPDFDRGCDSDRPLNVRHPPFLIRPTHRVPSQTSSLEAHCRASDTALLSDAVPPSRERGDPVRKARRRDHEEGHPERRPRPRALQEVGELSDMRLRKTCLMLTLAVRAGSDQVTVSRLEPFILGRIPPTHPCASMERNVQLCHRGLR